MVKTLDITPGRIATVLGSIVSLLLIINLGIIYLHFVKGYEHLKGFIRGFYFDTEANIPSLYSALAILLCSGLLWLISVRAEEKQERRSRHWKFLALVFLFLAVDEFASIHEYLIKPVKSLVDDSSVRSGYLHFAWFIPYGIATLILAVVYLRFYIRLPKRTRWLLFYAGFLFLFGAVVMEMVGGNYWAEKGWSIEGTDKVDLHYALIITLEEFLEMVGIIVFAYALSDYYLKNRRQEVLVRFTEK